MTKPTRMASGLYRNLPLGRDVAAITRRVEVMEKLLERTFTVPGTKQKFGLDFIIGLVPVAGDFVAAALGGYIVWEARNLGMSKTQLARMCGNVGFDWAIGLIPFVGDAADFFYRSNTRNLRIIRKHLDKHHPSGATIDQHQQGARR